MDEMSHGKPNDRTFRPDAAHRLEDPERLQWLPPKEVIEALKLKKTSRVADIGAGTGYFAIPIAAVAARVYAVDFQSEMLALFRRKLHAHDAPSNIELIEGEARKTSLPDACCDVVLIANVFHELDARGEVLREMRRILVHGGTLSILDWRADVEPPPGPPAGHRLAMIDVIDELRRNGWNVARTTEVGRFSYMVVAG